MEQQKISKVSDPLALTLILFIGFLGYGSTFDFSFQFDDEPTIILNPAIKDIDDLNKVGSFYPPRFLGIWSFALNYHFGKLNPFGYHLVNFLLHIFTAFLVFKFVRLVGMAMETRRPVLQTSEQAHKVFRLSVLALFAGLIFVAHPIQTQAVTYITQRFTLLSAFFYLLAMIFYLKFILSRETAEGKFKSSVYYAIAFVVAVVAMFCKQNTFTLPFAVVLLEYFFAISFPGKSKTRLLRLMPFLLILMIIPVTIWMGSGFDKVKVLALEEDRLSRSQYFLTQFAVLATYLRLMLFPVNQNLDYDYPVSSGFFSGPTVAPFVLLMGILLLGIRLFKNHRPASFGIFFFFLALGVESSVIPLDNVIYEHRLYLPSVGFFISAIFGIYYVSAKSVSFKPMGLLLGLLVAILVADTYCRNRVWQDELTLWADVVSKSPRKSRGHYNLGVALASMGADGPAIVEYHRALAINPEDPKARLNLGMMYSKMSLQEKAIEQYRLALARRPDYADAYYNIGVAHTQLKQADKAAEYYKRTLTLDPGHALAHNNLAVFYHSKGEFSKAIDHADLARQAGYSVHPEFLALLKPYRK